MVPVMSEEQVKAAETKATAQVEENVVEEISEEDLAGVAGGANYVSASTTGVVAAYNYQNLS